MMKRILVIALALVTVCALCIAFVGCSGAKRDESGLEYTLDKETDTYSVSGYSGTGEEIEIPQKYDSKPVTSISSRAFKGNKTVKKIVIPDGIKSIGANAFYGCSELEEVIFKDGSAIKEIATGTFSGCSKLDNVELPHSVTKIGYKAFNNCTAMKTVSLPNDLQIIGYFAFSAFFFRSKRTNK